MSRPNTMTEAILAKYAPVVERSSDGTWRLWAQEYHIHHNPGCYGDFVGQGDTLDRAAFAMLKQAEGGYVHPTTRCCEGCPQYDPFDL